MMRTGTSNTVMTPSSLSRPYLGGCLLSLILILSFSLPCLSQETEISGEVSDNDGPLPGVIVSTRSGDGRTVAYCVTDSGGMFSLPSSGVASLEASLLGYRKVILKPPFTDRLVIVMEESEQSLPASRVTSSAVVAHGDTITYDAARVRTSEDRVLGDMIARLPGIQVSESGAVTYAGKAINRLYIDGRNVLDNDHSLATRHLDVNSVRSVSIIEHHQPIKALRQSIRSQTAAMNVELNDDARGRIMLEGSASAGYDGVGVPYGFSGSAIKLSGRLSSMNVLGFDGSGHPYDSREGAVNAAPDGADEHFSLEPVFTLASDISDIDRSLAVYNSSRIFKTKDKLTFGGDAVLGGHFTCSKDAASVVSGHSIKYSYPDMEMVEDVSRASDSRFISGGLDIESNRERCYVRDDACFSFSIDGGSSAMSGSRTLSDGVSVSAVELNNTLKLALTGRDGRSLTGQVYTQYSEDNGAYSSSWGSLSQTYTRRALWNRISLSGISRKFNDLQFGLTPSLTVYSGGMRSLASGELPSVPDVSLENNLGMTSITPELSLGMLYQHRMFSSIMMAKGMFKYFDIRSSLDSDTYLVLSPMLYWGGEYTSGCWTANASVSVMDTASSETEFTEGYLITGYNSLRRGLSRPSVQPSAEADVGIEYKHPINQIMAGLSFGVSRQTAPVPQRWLADGYVFSSEGENFARQDGFGPSCYFSKSIFSLDAKVESKISYKRMRAVMEQNGVSYGYSGGLVVASLGISASPARWLFVRNDSNFNSSRFLIDDDSALGSIFLHNVSGITFRISSDVSLEVSGDYYLNRSDDFSTLFLVGASVSWKLSDRLSLFLTGSNLLNAEEYRRTSVSPLVESMEYVRLRPRTVLIGLDWRR